MFRLEPAQFLVLPWDHRVEYSAGWEHAWLLGGIHIVPRLDAGAPQTYELAHAAGATVDPHPGRGDVRIAGLEEVVSGDFQMAGGLSSLVDYIVAWGQRPPFDDEMARVLARVLLAELRHVLTDPSVNLAGIPQPLRSIMVHIRQNLRQPQTVLDLARLGGVSPATLSRLFRQHLHVAPMTWVRNTRMAHAEHLLRTTAMRVGEVGREVGIDDPYHFSKLFKRLRGANASTHRRHGMPF